jgi:manganese oxidase
MYEIGRGSALPTHLHTARGVNRHRAFTDVASAVAFAASMVMALLVALGGPRDHGEHLPSTSSRLVELALLVPLHLALAGIVLVGIGPARHARSSQRAPSVRRARRRPVARAALVCAAATITATGVVTSAGAPGADAVPAGGVCPAGARDISYDVVAIQTVIPVNGWGDKVLDGLVYVLRSHAPAVVANPNLTQPLVVRANVGDCVTVHFENQITGRNVGMHPDPVVQFDPKDSDGAHVGFNPDTTVPTGGRITYTWYADRVGQGAIGDPGNLDSALPNLPSAAFGLYGAIVVHPTGSTWHDPVTGAALLGADGSATGTQLFADVRVPGAPDLRSFVMVIGDEMEGVTDRFGSAPTFPSTGLHDATFGLNYRSEPLRNRLRAVLDHRGERRWDPSVGQFVEGDPQTVTLPNLTVIQPTDHFCDGYVAELDRVVDDPGAKCVGEEMHLQSWPFGDEGKLVHAEGGALVVDSDNLIPKAYAGDPVTFHVVHPGTKETHPWHQHTQRWLQDATDSLSPRKDVQSVAPGDNAELVIEGGAGGLQGTIGDSIFHCHLYPHFAQGFWGHLRIIDKLRDGTPLTVLGGASGNHYPDGTPIENLVALPDRQMPTAPTPERPGFPLFVFGQYLQRAYRIPYAVVQDEFTSAAVGGVRRPGDTVRGPTVLEANGLPALSPDKPGNGYIDPCVLPEGGSAQNIASPRVYRPHAIDLPLTYNRAGWGSPEGRIYVEENHLARVRSGQQQPEPYTVRARLGECVQILTTNDFHKDESPADQARPIDILGKYDHVFQAPSPTTEVSTHVHLVRFDELGSDGTSVGWNYVQAAMLGQTYGYRWFVDQPLRTVYFHDHQYPNSQQQRGLFASMNIEPPDATWHDPRTGLPTDGIGTQADIRSPSRADFREFNLYHEDRVPMWRTNATSTAPGQPVVPPPAPDAFGADQGSMSFNYRNEPFPIRVPPGSSGQRAEPGYVFSSAVHGDPSTPVLRAYAGDPVIIRNIVGSHEEMHTFTLHGHRWLSQPDNPLSTPTDTQSLAIAEWFNYELVSGRPRFVARSRAVTLRRAAADDLNGSPMILASGGGPDGPGGAGMPGDYLYGATSLDEQWQGLWGIFRVFRGRVTSSTPSAGGALMALPDRTAPSSALSPWGGLKPGEQLRRGIGPGLRVCRIGDPLRTYDIVAMQRDIVYDAGAGDHDPHGLLYVLAADEAAVRAGTKAPEPLFIRANAGDCLIVRLTNKLAADVPVHAGDVVVQPDSPWPAGGRVSIHPGMVDLDPVRADGTTVGFNFDQTVGRGQSDVFTWYVPANLEGATANLVDYGNRRGHRHHGMWGGLLIEPKGSTWTHPSTGAAITTGASAVIRWTTAAGVRQVRREFIADFQDGLRLVDAAGTVIPTPAALDDPYELGMKGINYRTERFAPRLATDPVVAHVLSSSVHGDPSTPVFTAYVGDQIWLRALMGGDRGRAHSFLLHGHEWRRNRDDPASTLRSAQDGLMPGRAFTFELVGGAGGRQQRHGDYAFRDGNMMGTLNAGLWGILRVFPPGAPAAQTGILAL